MSTLQRMTLATFVSGALVWPLGTGAATAVVPDLDQARSSAVRGPDLQHPQDLDDLPLVDQTGRPLDVDRSRAAPRQSPSATASATDAADTPAVGARRTWIALDDVAGRYYLKDFELRAVGEKIEVWVAEGSQGSPGRPATDDLQFLPGDCRNGVRTAITDEQIADLVAAFDDNIHPTESAAFSTPPDRDGSEAADVEGLETAGEGDNIVTLVDNVRDANFYDRDNTRSFTYIAGFFSSAINELTDRNVMTIDGFDWLHRTGAFPPDEPSSDPCTNAPARPSLYEGVFAHEYQHLLEYYADPDEVSWVNEGLSDYASFLTGYGSPGQSVFQPQYDGHIQCFLGHLTVRTPYNTIPREDCGPGNSLTLWGDQGADNTLADYGAAATMMEFLADRYGPDFLSQLHRQAGNGLQGLQDVLDVYAPGTQAQDVLHDWAVMVALDARLDRGGRFVGEGEQSRFQTASLNASISWSNPEAYRSGEGAVGGEGAPPNGSDYVRPQDAQGRPLSGRQLRTIEFQGAPALPARPVEWTVDASPEGHASAALHAGTGDNLDRSLAREITVPATGATLTFDTRWSTEPGFDSGFVQISTDDGRTWTSLGNADTVNELSPSADPELVEDLPGFNGEGGWKTTTFSLQEYAGQTVWLGFRYVSDANTNGDGWWIDAVSVSGDVLSDGTTLTGWQTYTQLQPTPVAGYTVQVVGYSDTPRFGPVAHAELALDRDFRGALDPRTLLRGVRTDLAHVGVLVTFDEPTETVQQYAPYRLLVNGVLQPGGGWALDRGAGGDPRV